MTSPLITRIPHHDDPGETCFITHHGRQAVRIETTWGNRPTVFRPATMIDAWGCARDGWRPVDADHETVEAAIAHWTTLLAGGPTALPTAAPEPEQRAA